MRVQVCATPHTLACVFKCRGIRKHDFQFPDTASVPFNPETSKTEKESERERKEKKRLSVAQPSTQHNTTNQNCKVEFTSPQERNKQVPQELQKTYEYKMLISSDRFHPPPRQICVFIFCFALA